VPRDFDEVKKLVTLPTKVVSLCLAGDLIDEITGLERALDDAKPPTNVGEASPKRVIAERIVAVQEQMRDSTVEFHLRAMGSRAWTRFWAGMPARGENEPAEDWGERVFPFYAELVSRSAVDPVMSAEQVAELADLLHAKAWNDLAGACMALNMDEVDVPNSAAASELTLNSGLT